MSNYDIVFTELALSPQGIHLLRNKFNYKSIAFTDVHSAAFVRAADTQNIPLAIGAGAGFIGFALYNLFGVYENYNDPRVYTIYIESIIWPLLLLMGGSYCLYLALKKAPLLIIWTKDKKYKLNLKDAILAQQLPAMEVYLNAKLPGIFRGGSL